MTSWLTALRRHKTLKILSLLLALALWFAVSGQERTETTVSVTLELVNLPKHLMVTSELPPALQVRVVGPRSIITKLSQTRLTQSLDLSDYKNGRQTFYLGPSSFSFPRGVQVIRIQPNPLSLTLDTTMIRTLSIKPVLEGKPPEGYDLVSIKMRPDQVIVKGPHRELADLDSIPTLPIDLSNLTENMTVATDLDVKNLHLTLKNAGSILADIAIETKTLTRTIPGIPVIVMSKPASLSPANVTVVLQGPWSLVKDLSLQNLQARVDTKNLDPGRHRLNVSVNLPPGIRLVRLQPATITVRISKPS